MVEEIISCKDKGKSNPKHQGELTNPESSILIGVLYFQENKQDQTNIFQDMRDLI